MTIGCLDEFDSPCDDGLVLLWFALSGSGERYPRCEKHYEAYVERVQPRIDEVRERYPDSSFAPSWFDPSYAGESWDDDY